ncbi:PepSY domain-containing protein [Planobispora rosea]|uniref:PepSY domain-containing protein n=1 Tax=Planobispora rosea TaxID=35762 RepID=UPI00083AC88B|nr:PepSY domain-containing protein [Planobispora rosea]
MRRIDAVARTALATGTAALLLAGGGAAQAAGGAATATTPAAAIPVPAPDSTSTPVPAPAPAADEITSERAVEIAKEKAPGAEVISVERVHEQGIWTWWVRMEEGVWRYDLYISTKSGRIVRLKINYNW